MSGIKEAAVNIGLTAGAGYLLVTRGAQMASAVTDFGIRAAPVVSQMTYRVGVFILYAALAASEEIAKRAPIVAEKLVNFGRNFNVLSNLSPAMGITYGFGIAAIAALFDHLMKDLPILNYSLPRLVVSHITAGAAIFGISAIAAKAVGVAALALTPAGALALTATALTISAVVKVVAFGINGCFGETKREGERRLEVRT